MVAADKYDLPRLLHDMLVHQGIIGQLHRQLRHREAPPPKKSWLKFWQR
jgi:hypothetical protein